MVDLAKETKEFFVFLEQAKQLDKKNKEKYKPVLQSWTHAKPQQGNQAKIILEIQMGFLDTKFEVSFYTIDTKNFTIISPPQGEEMYEKAKDFFNGYIGWEKDVLEEIKNKTPYRMFFIM